MHSAGAGAAQAAVSSSWHNEWRVLAAECSLHTHTADQLTLQHLLLLVPGSSVTKRLKMIRERDQNVHMALRMLSRPVRSDKYLVFNLHQH